MRFSRLLFSQFLLHLQQYDSQRLGITDGGQLDLFAVIGVKDQVRVAENAGAESGADLDVFDLFQGDLDLAMRGKEGIDLAVETVFGDKYQSADPGDDGARKSDKSDQPEAECEDHQRSSGPCRVVQHEAEKPHYTA